MLRLLLPLFFLLLPLAEIACFILVGRRIGLFPTLSLVVFSAVAGVVLMRIQGFGVLARLRQSAQEGRAPGNFWVAHEALETAYAERLPREAAA